MALFDAKEYDPEPARRKRLFGGAVLLMLACAFTVWFWPTGRLRFYPEWGIASRFLSALQHQDFDTAYALYNADSQWKQHPDKYKQYDLSQFMLDWGPSSDFGPITSYSLGCAIEPPKSGFASSSGIVIEATINGRPEPILLWVEKKSHTISISPRSLEFLTRHSPLVRAACYRPG